jgi:hypothetical protein
MWILFWILASICDSVQDTLSFRFSTSIFGSFNKAFWNPVYSHAAAKRIFGYKVDAWHLFKSAKIVLEAFAIPAYFYLPNYRTGVWWIDISIALVASGIAWNGIFNLFYHRLWPKSHHL